MNNKSLQQSVYGFTPKEDYSDAHTLPENNRFDPLTTVMANKSLKDLNDFSKQEMEKLENSTVGNLIRRAKDLVSTHFGEKNDESSYLAENENTPSATLNRLSEFPAANVRRLVASNPSTPFDTILSMKENSSNSFLSDLDVAMHPNATNEHIIAAASKLDPLVVGELLEKDYLPTEALEKLAFGRPLEYWTMAEGEVDINADAKERLIDEMADFGEIDFTISELGLLLDKSKCKTEAYSILVHKNGDSMLKNKASMKLLDMNVDMKDLRDPNSGRVVEYNKFAKSEIEVMSFDDLEDTRIGTKP